MKSTTSRPPLVRAWFLQWLVVSLAGIVLGPLIVRAADQLFDLSDVHGSGLWWRITLVRLPVFLPISYVCYKWSVILFVLPRVKADAT